MKRNRNKRVKRKRNEQNARVCTQITNERVRAPHLEQAQRFVESGYEHQLAVLVKFDARDDRLEKRTKEKEKNSCRTVNREVDSFIIRTRGAHLRYFVVIGILHASDLQLPLRQLPGRHTEE